MPFFKGRGGSIFEMDLPNPKITMAVELRAEKLAKGDLVEIPAERVRKVETPQFDRNGHQNGVSYKWVEIEAEPEPAAKPSARTAKPAREPDPSATPEA